MKHELCLFVFEIIYPRSLFYLVTLDDPVAVDVVLVDDLLGLYLTLYILAPLNLDVVAYPFNVLVEVVELLLVLVAAIPILI